MSWTEITQTLAGHPVLYATLSGLGGAILIDVMALKARSGWRDAWSHFSLEVATWRWFQGMLGSFLAALGLGTAGTIVALGLHALLP